MKEEDIRAGVEAVCDEIKRQRAKLDEMMPLLGVPNTSDGILMPDTLFHRANAIYQLSAEIAGMGQTLLIFVAVSDVEMDHLMLTVDSRALIRELKEDDVG